ncbi:fibronectin type III domain-containing protein [Chryseobacterium gossypii]|uniref:fibronectin type III domain-containing protein n=1 Tax=Chryseobacterium gossypii TaxID=3231602 RepID=UPI00352476C1
MKKLLLMCWILLGISISAQITLGSGTNKGPAPVSTYYGYSYVQQIFPKTEINANAAGNITGLKFYLSPNATLTNSDSWVVYLGHTTKTSFTSTSDWIPLSELTQVFNGTVTNNAGVVEITLSTPFAYNNTDNLVIAAEENKADYDSNGSSEAMYVYSSASNSTLYYRSDTTNPDPNGTLPTGSRTANKSIVTIMGLEASALPVCPGVTSPSVSATGVSVTPTFDWNAVSNATGYRLSIGTTSGGTDVMNNVDLGNVTTYTLSTPLLYGKQYFYTLSSYNANGSSTGCSERDFTTKNITCPTVTAPAANATSMPLTPTITWDAVTDATGYRISVGTTAGGTDVLNNVDLGNVTSYTFTTALASSTKYYYTVNAYTPNNTSASCSERSFTTLCTGAISTLPWTENFDNMSNVGSGVVQTCWTQVAGTKSWASMNSSSTSYNAPKSTPNYMSIAYGNTVASQLWTPAFALTAGTTYEFSFYYNTNGTSSSYVGFSGDVQVNTTADTAGATTIGTFITSTQGTSSYTQYKVVYTPATTGNYYFGLNVSSTSAPWYLGVDDFQLQVAPTCLEPSAITSANATTGSVDISWTAPASAPAGGYDVYYDTTNTAPTSTTTPNYTGVSGTTQTLSNLTAATSYYVWVRSHCSSTDQSTWVGPYIASTSITNDNCSAPVELTVGTTFESNAIVGTNVGATSDETPLSCQTNANNNVWYSVTVPASGNLTIETKSVTGSQYTDSVINAFTGSCGALVEAGCDDDTGDGNFSKLTLTGQTPGTVLLISVWRWSNSSVFDGQFQISAYDASALATHDISVAKDNIKVYPNPFAEVLNISDAAKVKNVLITDMAGRLVKTIANPASALYLAELKSGMYLITMEMKDGSKQAIKAIKK